MCYEQIHCRDLARMGQGPIHTQFGTKQDHGHTRKGGREGEMEERGWVSGRARQKGEEGERLGEEKQERLRRKGERRETDPIERNSHWFQ